MIRVEVIEEFTLNDFKKLKNIVRKGKDVAGRLYVGDTFECDQDMMEYLTGKNKFNKVVVKVIEVIPEVKVEEAVTPMKNEDTLKNEKIVNEIVKNVKKSKKKKK